MEEQCMPLPSTMVLRLHKYLRMRINLTINLCCAIILHAPEINVCKNACLICLKGKLRKPHRLGNYLKHCLGNLREDDSVAGNTSSSGYSDFGGCLAFLVPKNVHVGHHARAIQYKKAREKC